jgi:hypothetical protein
MLTHTGLAETYTQLCSFPQLAYTMHQWEIMAKGMVLAFVTFKMIWKVYIYIILSQKV